MKVLNLQCARLHSFEGWFGSEVDFQDQLGRGLVECPLCADKGIQKMPSAPRLNFGGHQKPGTSRSDNPQTRLAAAGSLVHETTPAQPGNAGHDSLTGASQAEQGAFLKALRHVLSNTEDVGNRFADEARRMHYGDAETRSIRGQASAREAVELIEEGIDVLPLPLPAALKETLQ